MDPANPTSPITVEPGNDISPARLIYNAGYNGPSRTVTNQHLHALVYAKTDGKLYRVSALKSGSLKPEQVSNESESVNLCSALTRANVANPANAVYVYLLSGPDRDCTTDNDNTWKMVRLSMSPSDTPISAIQPIASLIDSNSGEISGWLVNDKGTLSQCDSNFANCIPIAYNIDAARIAINIDVIKNRFLLDIDNVFYIYDGNNTAARFLSQPLFSIPASPQKITVPTTDGTHVYFSLGKSIYRFPTDGTAAVDLNFPLHTDTETTIITSLDLTDNKVIFQTGSTIIKSVDKNGGLSNILTSTPVGGQLTYFVSGNYIYYGVQTLITSHAGIVDENGINRTAFNNANWVGLLQPTSADYSKSTRQLNDPAVVILAQGSGNGLSGAVIKSYNANTATEKATLGTLPVSGELVLFFCSGYINNALCLAAANSNLSAPASPVQIDTFFLNAETENSLLRLTNTKDKNEIPLF